MKNAFNDADIKAILIKKRDSRKPDEDGYRDTRNECANEPLGCNRSYWIDEKDEDVKLPPSWAIDHDEKMYCEDCTSCRVCERSLKSPQIIKAPGGRYSSVFGGRSFGGICRQCYNKIKAARANFPKHEIVYPGKNGKPLPGLKSLSTGNIKLYGYFKLVHDKDPWRVFEIGYFKITLASGTQELVRYTQIGTTCELRRGRQVQVYKKCRTQFLPEFDGKNDLSYSRYLSKDYDDNMHRVVDYFLGIGYHVVEKKDTRNGRADKVTWDEAMSKPARALEEQREQLDKSLGDRHAEKIDKIDMKYRMRQNKPATNWMEEAVKR